MAEAVPSRSTAEARQRDEGPSPRSRWWSTCGYDVLVEPNEHSPPPILHTNTVHATVVAEAVSSCSTAEARQRVEGPSPRNRWRIRGFDVWVELSDNGGEKKCDLREWAQVIKNYQSNCTWQCGQEDQVTHTGVCRCLLVKLGYLSDHMNEDYDCDHLTEDYVVTWTRIVWSFEQGLCGHLDEDYVIIWMRIMWSLERG